MGDTSPKNKHKLEDQKHEDQLRKEDGKQKNAEVQHHHSDHHPTAEPVNGLPAPEEQS